VRFQFTPAFHFIRDLFYPTLDPLSKTDSDSQAQRASEEESEFGSRIAALPDSESLLAPHLNNCRRVLDEEEEARRGIEARLSTVVGLSSIAGTIVFGALLAQVAGSLGSQGVITRWLMALGTLYAAVQVCWAILAAVRGLGRRNYIAPTASDILPSSEEGRAAFVRRQIAFCAQRLQDGRLQNKAKVDQMALAHCAMRNFIVGLAILTMLGTASAIVRRPSDTLIQTLRTNQELNELLRGPQGPKGDSGMAGPKGEPCTEPTLVPHSSSTPIVHH